MVRDYVIASKLLINIKTLEAFFFLSPGVFKIFPRPAIADNTFLLFQSSFTSPTETASLYQSLIIYADVIDIFLISRTDNVRM